MKNLYLLPSPNPSRLCYFGDSPELRLTKYPNLFRVFERSTQHIYITGNGTLKEGDWTIWKDQLFKVDSNNAYSYTNNVTLEYAIKYLKKVILTTDRVFINEGVQAIPEEFLTWFVENQNCKEVVIIEKSRCCGRCNGVDDLCFTDMRCIDHRVYGCETCYGKRVEYSINIPKEQPNMNKLRKEIFEMEQELGVPSNLRWHNFKPKQETLEEARANSYINFAKSNEDVSAYSFVAGWDKGVKWQQERSYSEEEVLYLLKKLEIECVINPRRTEIEEWFEQNKKK